MNTKVAFLAVAGALIASTAAHAAQTANMTVQATITGSCDITANTLDFGSIATTTSDTDVATTADVTCTGAIPFQVGADVGLGTAPGTRSMLSGANELVYELYTDAGRTTVLENIGGANLLSGTGVAATPVSVDIYGRVPTQTTPAAGAYSDTVVLTVAY